MAPLPYDERRIAKPKGEIFALAIDAESALMEYLAMYYHLGRAGKALDRFGVIDFATTIAPGVRDVFIKRSQIVSMIRRFLDDRKFLEVETPMLQPMAGGARGRPFKSKHNAYDMDVFLRIAPELYLKRLLVGGLER